jgi:hypothetical protein
VEQLEKQESVTFNTIKAGHVVSGFYSFVTRQSIFL